MDPWEAVSFFGAPELWVSIVLYIVLVYVIMRRSYWKKPSARSRAFKATAMLLAASFLVSYTAVDAIKIAFPSERPCIPCPGEGCNPLCPDDSSFPSGHAASAFTVAMAMILVRRDPKLLILLVPAGLVAWSRVALGVHTVPDIVFGSLIGAASPFVARKLLARIPRERLGPLSRLRLRLGMG
jgi:membrane-associated phospholipid phosphatase